MAISFFSKDLANLFAGLSRGSKRLEPFSKRFQGKLGYAVFKFEQAFYISSGAQCHPDGILTSSVRATSLVLEWTASATVTPRKQQQIQNYAAITQSDLVRFAGIMKSEASLHDGVIIVLPHAVSDYASYITSNSLGLPVLQFSADETGFSLELAQGGFKDDHTHSFFEDGVRGKTIPAFWVKFALDSIHEEDLVDSVIARVVQRIIRGPRTFGTAEFARSLVPVWEQLSLDTQKRISTLTGALLSQLSRAQGISTLVSKDPSSTTWTVAGRDVFQSRVSYYHHRLQMFKDEIRGADALQPSLFD